MSDELNDPKIVRVSIMTLNDYNDISSMTDDIDIILAYGHPIKIDDSGNCQDINPI
jgi:hypothetical protein